jgi:hypothetical protein
MKVARRTFFKRVRRLLQPLSLNEGGDLEV